MFAFLMKIDGLGFSEVVERLARQVRRDAAPRGGRRPPRPTPRAPASPADRGPPRRPVLLRRRVGHARRRRRRASSSASAASTRPRPSSSAIGFAPRDGDALLRHLRQKGFTEEETVAAGLVAVGRSSYDRFRGRLLWPIRESSGETIGFGARRIFDDDRIEAKYLNTPETAIYKKSQVLYGLDLARRDIARSMQAVVVEGYTDVMACHLSGVPTAVATCGTAFGDDHARVLRRFLNDHEEFRGEVIFTFDGDAAGQKAALRAFGGDQNFVAQTYVAVEPTGLDPCDLRIQHGDAAVRELIARRRPLYRFVLENVVSKYDLDRADGRVDAVREAARLVSSIRDKSKVEAFARELAGMVGVDVEQARTEVRRAAGRAARPAPQAAAPVAPQGESPPLPAAPPLPDLRDPRFALERETLKLVVQEPEAVARTTRDIGANDFTHPTYRAVWGLVEQSGGLGAADAGWAARLRDAASDQAVAAALSALAVEPVPSRKGADDAFVANTVYRLQELTAQRRIADVKSRLQRTNPVEHTAEYNRMFGELTALEQHRRQLRDLALGAQ